MRKTSLLLITFCFISNTYGKFSLDDYCTKVLINDSTRVSLYTSTMFRVRVSELKAERFPVKYEVPFLIGKLENWGKVEYQKKENEYFIYVITSDLKIKFSKKNNAWTVWHSDENEKIYPSEAPIYGMFKDGYSVFDNASAFHEVNLNSRYSHWFYNSETRRYVDTYLKEDLISDTYFIYGPDYAKIFSQFNELVGPEPLLPRKAYGYFQTQHLACEGDQKKLMKVAQMFRDKDIPCDNLILDFEWGDGCDGSKEVKWGSRLDWNKNYTFPLSPKEMLDSLENMHFNVMTIHHNAPEFVNRVNQGWTECTYDETLWWKKFKEQIDIGIDGTWQDTRMNDITDGVIWNGTQDYIGHGKRVLFMGCRRMQMITPWNRKGTYPSQHPFNQMIGGRRYPFDWTGDADFTWSELRWHINAITNQFGSMKGISYLTCDATAENWKIKVRWNQFVNFLTVARSHNSKPWQVSFDNSVFLGNIKIEGRDSIAGGVSKEREMKIFPLAENSIRKYLKLRYRLIPYLYSYAYVNYLTGMPVCRPMLLEYPNDGWCMHDQWPYQYMFGSEILVAPVYGDFNSMEIYLPIGEKWIDYWSKEIYEGGRKIVYGTKNIEKLPLFIKAGAIIPMRQESNWLDPDIPDTITFDIYPSRESSFSLYEDDNKSIDYQKGAYGTTLIKCRSSSKRLEIEIGEMTGQFEGKPKERNYTAKINLVYSIPKSVNLNGKKMYKRENDNVHEDWFFDRKENVLYVNVNVRTNQKTLILVSY